MLSLISIGEFVDRLYPPVHGARTFYARVLVKTLRNAGITDLVTLLHTAPEQLMGIKYVGPVFISQAELHLAGLDCRLGMSDTEIKEALLAKL